MSRIAPEEFEALLRESVPSVGKVVYLPATSSIPSR